MALENATQPGVETQEPVEGAPLPTEREQTMAEITARIRQERDDEIVANGGQLVDTKTPPPEDAAQEVSPAQEQTGTIAATPLADAAPPADDVPPSPPAGGAPSEELVTIQVDGVLQQVSTDKIYEAGVRAVQKESSADRRLEEATRLLRHVEQQVAPRAEPTQNTPPPQAWDEEIIAYALAHGNEEQKAEAVRQIRGGRQELATPDQVAAIAEARILDKVDFQNTVDWFQKEFKDVVSDPYLLQLASLQEDHMRANGDRRPRQELYAEIGTGLRKLRGGGAPVATTLEDKRNQKASITNLPAASARRTTPQAPAPKSPSQIIEEMRTKRGQAA